MKNKSIIFLLAAIVTALAYNAFVGGFLAYAIGLPVVAGASVIVCVGIAINLYKHIAGAHTAFSLSAFHARLAQEVYLAELLKKFRSNGSFLARARDFSAYVQNDVINFAEAGSDPDVIEDYDHVDPLDIADDEDTPKTMELKSFSTIRTKITETAQGTRAYNIMQDRVMRHSDTLAEKVLKYSATQYAPAANGTYTPIVRTSGATSGGIKKISLDNVIALDVAMRNMDVPGARILVLNPTHLGDLQSEDKDLFKGFVPTDPNASFKLFGFETYVSTAVPRYTTDGAPVIKAWNAASEAGDLIASFAFVANEVARAQGSIKLFKDLDTASYQASFISARVAFIAKQLRAKYVGALVAKTA